MKKTLLAWASAMALVCGLAVPTITPALAKPSQAAARQGAMARPQRNERHPEIRQALGALQNAKRHLENGAHDFGGHRAKALELTNQAIEECHAALQYDKK